MAGRGAVEGAIPSLRGQSGGDLVNGFLLEYLRIEVHCPSVWSCVDKKTKALIAVISSQVESNLRV